MQTLEDEREVSGDPLAGSIMDVDCETNESPRLLIFVSLFVDSSSPESMN